MVLPVIAAGAAAGGATAGTAAGASAGASAFQLNLQNVNAVNGSLRSYKPVPAGTSIMDRFGEVTQIPSPGISPEPENSGFDALPDEVPDLSAGLDDDPDVAKILGL